MASVSNLKKKIDRLRYKYLSKKSITLLNVDYRKLYEDLVDEVITDINDIDQDCYSRNRY